MLFLFDRIKNKILREYRRKVFIKAIKSDKKNVKILGKVYVQATNVRIGNNVVIYPGAMFWGDGEIVIGDNVDIGKDTIIFASKYGGVIIGSNVAIAAQCYIIDCDHGTMKNNLIRNQSLVAKPVNIGNDVWIAANCTILKGSRIKDGAVIGAKSLVNSDIEENGIAVGIPAKVIKYRQDIGGKISEKTV